MRVLIVDDDEITLEILDNALTESGYEVERASDGLQALQMIRTGRFRLVISDWEMPGMNGLELCRKIRSRQNSSYIYFILLTSRDSTENVVEGLDAGADDFIAKPFQPMELCVRLRAGERILSLDSRDVIIFSLAKLAESRDPETGVHLERMREYCRVLADHLSNHPSYADYIDGDYVLSIYQTSPLHDIGKVGIPDDVLLKPGRLTEEEFEVMKTHASIGAETLGAALQQFPDAEFLKMAYDIALTHHEKFDGSGYPRGLSGQDIPLCGRILALADVYDALTTKRTYKEAYCHEVARDIILEGRGSHFDPDVVDCFLEKEDEFIAILKRFSEAEVESAADVRFTADAPA